MPRKTDFKISLGNRIRYLRNINSITQEELGKKLNVGKTTIANYESGYSEPESEKISMLANIFNISTDYLLGKTIYKNSKEYESEVNLMLQKLKELPDNVRNQMLDIALDLSKENLSEEEFYNKVKYKFNDIPKEYIEVCLLFSKYLYDETLYKKDEDFDEEDLINNTPTINNKILDLSSLTDEEIEEVKNFIDYLISKRNK